MYPTSTLDALLALDTSGALFAAWTVTLLVAVVTVVTVRWHGRHSFDAERGVQDAHDHPTPRVGGLAVLVGLYVAQLLATVQTQALLTPLLMVGSVAFLVGFIEDISGRVGVLTRLLITMACGMAAWWLTDVRLERLDVPLLDDLLLYLLPSVLLTAFAVGGVVNSVNIIDGLNGLAVGSVGISLGAFALLALSLGDTALASTALVLCCAALGFGAINWPWGKLFLGDGGAYLLGFGLAWVAVLMQARHPEVSPWAAALICSHPVMEVLFSIWRRMRRKSHPGMPDRLHLHSLVHRRLARRLLPGGSALARNSLGGALMWPAALLPAVLALQFSEQSGALVLSCLACALLYSSVYARLTQFRWCITAALPRRTAQQPS